MGLIESVATSIFVRIGSEGLKNILTEEKSTVRDRMRLAFDKAQSRFHKKYKNKYGDSANTFLASQENFDKFIRSLDFDKQLTPEDYSKKGFNGVEDVPVEIIQEFINWLDDEIENDLFLKTHFGLHQAIQDGKINRLLIEQIIELLSESKSKKIPKHLTKIPLISLSDVVGREKEIKNIKSILEKSDKPVVINGLGGMGKTTLVKTFIETYDKEFDHLIWIQSATTLLDTILGDISLIENMGIREELEIKMKEKKYEEAVELLLNKIKTVEGNNLIVIDNCQINDLRTLELLFKYLIKNWKVLLTSRYQIRFCKKYELHILNPVKAKELFLRYYHQEATGVNLDILLKNVGYHTLTIELLAKTINKNFTVTIENLIEYLTNHQLDNKRLAQKIITDHSNDEVEVYTHLISIFDLDKLTENEKYILKQFAILPPIEIEGKKLYSYLGIKEEEQNDFISTLENLTRKGYVVKNDCLYKVHQILQDIVIYKFGLSFSDCEVLIDYFTEVVFIDQSKDNPIDKFPMAEYGSYLSRRIELIFRSNNKLDITQGEKYSLLLNCMATLYAYLGRYNERVEFLEKAYKSDIRNFGTNHDKTFITMSNLALAYVDIGKITEAAEILEEVLQGEIKYLGEQHSRVSTCKANLATVYKDLGKYEVAKELLESSLNNAITNLGENHPTVARRQSNLAVIYTELRKNKEAASMLENALKTNIEIFGEEHLDVATIRINLSLAYRALGKIKEAVLLAQQALSSDIKNFGENHPNIVSSKSNLAYMYTSSGKYLDAEGMLKSALESANKIYGENHPEVANLKSRLALVNRELGRYEEAVLLATEAVNFYVNTVGEENCEVARCQSDLAFIYRKQSRFDEAAALLKKALDINIKNFGTEHPIVARNKSNLAFTYIDLRKYEESARLFEEAIKFECHYFGYDSVDVALKQSVLASAYLKLEKREVALELLKKTRETFIKLLGEKDSETVKIENKIRKIENEISV